MKLARRPPLLLPSREATATARLPRILQCACAKKTLENLRSQLARPGAAVLYSRTHHQSRRDSTSNVVAHAGGLDDGYALDQRVANGVCNLAQYCQSLENSSILSSQLVVVFGRNASALRRDGSARTIEWQSISQKGSIADCRCSSTHILIPMQRCWPPTQQSKISRQVMAFWSSIDRTFQ
jgi:hypothetical protein